MPVADQDPLSALPLAKYRPYSRLRLPQSDRDVDASVGPSMCTLIWDAGLTGERWAVPDVAAFVRP